MSRQLTSPGCLFCRIVGGEVPATLVAETDDAVAFRDLNPQATLHVLVVPRDHHADVAHLAAADPGLLAAVVWSIGQSILLSLVVSEQYSAYGIVGALMAVMFWFYYASAVVFLGAEFTRALSAEAEASPGTVGS